MQKFIVLTLNQFASNDPQKIAIRVDYITRVHMYARTIQVSVVDGATYAVLEPFDEVLRKIQESQDLPGV